jgi:hypothetical protein
MATDTERLASQSAYLGVVVSIGSDARQVVTYLHFSGFLLGSTARRYLLLRWYGTSTRVRWSMGVSIVSYANDTNGGSCQGRTKDMILMDLVRMHA